MSSLLSVHTPVPPVFKHKISSQDVNVGDHAKLECEIEDAPNVTFKWYMAGVEIKQGDKYRILSRQTTSSLELLHPVKADSAEYTCKASNQHGSDSCSANLTVTGKNPGERFIITPYCWTVMHYAEDRLAPVVRLAK